MKKTILLSLLLMLSIQILKAQSIFIKSGRNLTNYKFSSSTNESVFLQNEIGQNYEFGYLSEQPEKKRFYYGISLGLEQYNATGGNYSPNNLTWETNYAILKGLGYYKIFTAKRNQIAIKGGLGLATLIHGRQEINGTRYDLLNQDEFKGLFVSPQVGLAYSLSINNTINLHLDYDYANQLSVTNSNSDQKLSFINHSLSLGFSVNIN
jgi:hypothetical protein